ncbi:MAG: lamin tail domain-containing protein [Deltaproteobacteria bacterium]|nr:lamin tail domain-containing protein [Deltaproteobacteria bacterium]
MAPGKADDFLSLSAREYYLTGTTRIELPASWASRSEAERRAEVQRLIPYKQVVIGWFLNSYLVDKEEDESSYGGFEALTKNGSYEDMDLRAESDLVWAFDFRQEVGGQRDLVAAIPDTVDQGDGSWRFGLAVGKIGIEEMQRLDTDREWYRSAPWSSFDPSKVDASKVETVELTIRPEPASDDAWLEQERLFEDGTLTVGIHFGWDYHNAYHEKHSKQVYDWLLERGFKSPVARWEDLRHDAGPLRGTARYHGREIAVEISLFWGRAGDATDPDTASGGRQLEADMLTSLATREVVIFNGHSGPFYGFALANWRMTSEGDLDDSELAMVPLNEGNYQLIVAEGCDTYALGQAFYDNPSKPGLEDLDIITTTSFSNASSPATVTDLLTRLIGTKGSEVRPSRFSELLRDLDGNSSWFTTMYGVHGIDDDPTTHPWADLSKACAPCKSNATCGDGMRCVAMADGVKGCAAECTASLGCGQGYECRNVQVSGYLSSQVCAPLSLSCSRTVDESVVLLNEVLPAPKSDHNGDGVASGVQDEYIELVNHSAVAVDLAGWSLSDAVGVRHVFPAGTLVAPGGAVLVFGGGAPELVPGTTLVQTASTGALGLNNGGDHVRLSDIDGNAVDDVAYGAGTTADTSVQRRADGGREADWLEGSAATPGVAHDGELY